MTKLVLSTDLDKDTRAEMDRLLDALKKKYGENSVLAGTLMHNLLGIVSAGVNSIPYGEKREEFLRIALVVINDAMQITGRALGVKPDQVRPVCDAMSDYDDLVAGDDAKYLKDHAAAADAVIAKLRA